jgi:predicted metal-dependent phosphoesterase TrpH
LTGKIDLHAHTTASDGRLTPFALVDLAIEKGLTLLAVTDHDSTEGVAPALIHAAGSTLEVWPGVELSTDVEQGEVHMLGYFVDPTETEIQEMLTRLRWSRIGRAREIVEKLNELGMAINFERVKAIAGDGAIGRPHVAQALVEGGYVSTSAEAFDRFLSRTGPAYAERFKLTAVDAARLIGRAGGMPVLAHPMYISRDPGFKLDPFVRELCGAGLVGIECYYADASPEVVANLVQVARDFALIPTGGTDFHGPGVYATELGDRDIPAETIDRMRAWRQSHRRPGDRSHPD